MVKRNFFKPGLRSSILKAFFFLLILIAGNFVLSRWFHRFDFTIEKRFSLSESSLGILRSLHQPVHITVYLDGEMPAGFKRLRQATHEMLDEFSAYSNGNLSVDFQNPVGSSDQQKNDQQVDTLMKKGMTPINLQMSSGKGNMQKLIFPDAYVSSASRAIPVALLQNQNQSGGASGNEEILNNSVETLEFQLISAIEKVSRDEQPGIGFLSGNDELFGPGVADIVTTLKASYAVKKVILPAIPDSELLKLRLLILIKPQQKFTEPEKYKLDQYLMYGGRIMFLIDNLHAELDSMGKKGSTLGFPQALNLDDLFFKYGLRINYDLIKDLNCAPIPVLTGANENSNQQNLEPWVYYPIVMPPPVSASPIVRNIDPVRLEFANTIDTIGSRGIRKTILLTSSRYTKVMGASVYISLNDIGEGADTSKFQDGPKPVAVLLEGKFRSLFLHRSIDSADLSKPFLGESIGSSILVVSDGDIIKNQINSLEHSIYPLGFDKYTRQMYGNKTFIQNAVDYLAGQSDLVQLRSKQIKLRLLDKQQVLDKKLYWQMLNTVLPIFLVCSAGFILAFVRRRKYSKA